MRPHADTLFDAPPRIPVPGHGGRKPLPGFPQRPRRLGDEDDGEDEPHEGQEQLQHLARRAPLSLFAADLRRPHLLSSR